MESRTAGTASLHAGAHPGAVRKPPCWCKMRWAVLACKEGCVYTRKFLRFGEGILWGSGLQTAMLVQIEVRVSVHVYV
eukprot:1150838-Pelagomonas_calceolata.AAC.5